jgi:hypothetical protein
VKNIQSSKDQKLSISELKKDLIDDLDQFLLGNDIDEYQVKEEKQKALAELDKLIKQDLSYSQILTTIKKEVKTNQEVKTSVIEEVELVTPVIENSKDPLERSIHILDLRKSKEPAKVKTKKINFSKINLSKYKDSLNTLSAKAKKPKIKKEPKLKKHTWQIPSIKMPN